MKHSAIIFTLFLFAASGMAQRAEITVKNASLQPRTNEPVVVPWKQFGGEFARVDTRNLRLVNDEGATVDFQVDDITADSLPDEFVFQDSYTPGQTKHYTLEPVRIPPPATSPQYHTDARDWKRIKGVLQSVDIDDVPGNGRERKAYRFDGVGWESDSMAYRLYLDERNAVDLLGKRKPGLYWNYIGTSGVDYQADADWGMDILHVGNALGVGGIGFWNGDSVVKPVTVQFQKCRIVNRGPVRAVVRVEYQGWDLGNDTVGLSSTFIIYRGDRFCEHRVKLIRGRMAHELATGIVKHDSTSVEWIPGSGSLFTSGRQSRSGDSLMMAVLIPSAVGVRKIEGSYDHLLLTRIGTNTPAVRIFISACWQGEPPGMWSTSEIHSHLADIARRVREPLNISVKNQ